jgi:hypothetical protein
MVMKKPICFILAFTAILIITCNSPKRDAKENPLQGAWEVTYAKYVSRDTTIEIKQFANPKVKILTRKHFAFGSQSGENQISGGGGEYTIDGDTYTEYVKYHSAAYFVDKTNITKYSLDGDLWTISYKVKNDTVQWDATETWKRIIE